MASFDHAGECVVSNSDEDELVSIGDCVEGNSDSDVTARSVSAYCFEPWITNHITKMIRKINVAFLKQKHSKLYRDILNYKKLKQQVQKHIRQSYWGNIGLSCILGPFIIFGFQCF